MSRLSIARIIELREIALNRGDATAYNHFDLLLADARHDARVAAADAVSARSEQSA